jgi:type I restriction enzyme S subunit
MKGSKGTKMPRGDKNQILRFHIPEFNFTSQQKIASVLSALDNKIELNNRINAELEAMAKTLYDYWFVQFDFPDKNGKPYKTSGGKMVWNEELKREIPEGWEDGTLGDIAELVRGVTYDSSEIKSQNDSGVIPILRATNISGNVIDLNDMVYVPKQNVSPSQVLNKYDILITMSSGSKEHIGKNGFFFYEKEASFGAFCAKIVAKKEYRFYLYSYTQSDFMFTTIKNECLGTNINNLNGSLVKGFRIVVPPSDLIESFNNKVSSVYEKIGNNLIENQKLTELRDWLLPMLMNGQVKVK